MRISRFAFCAWMLAAVAASATSLRDPISGYVFDAATGLIRPINGLPGAATLGAALESPALFSKITFAPGQLAAIAVSRESETFLLELDGRQVAARKLADTPADLAAFDVTGKVAVIYSALGYRVLQAGTLSDAAPLAGITGAVRAIAIDSTAKTIAVAVEENDGMSVYAIENGAARFVAQAISVSSLTLSGSGSELMFADRQAGQIQVARRNAGEWISEVAADGRDGLNLPAAAGWSSRGTLLVLSSGSHEVMAKENGSWERLDVPAAIEGLEPMAAPGVMLLASKQALAPGTPLHLLEMRQQEGALNWRVVFVPVGGQQ